MAKPIPMGITSGIRLTITPRSPLSVRSIPLQREVAKETIRRSGNGIANRLLRIAEALGARDVPKSLAEPEAFFRAVRPEFVCGAGTREVLAALNAIELPIALAGLDATCLRAPARPDYWDIFR
ncbi:MAG: hypothetical protein ACRES7_05775 [Gammaproteobacteria bacterium]